MIPPTLKIGVAIGLAFLYLSLSAAYAASAYQMERMRYDNSLPPTIPMPQTTQWAKPYSLGNVKMLFITSYTSYGAYQSNSGGARIGVELVQRFDLDGSAIVFPIETNRAKDGAFDQYAVEVARDTYDCYVLTSLSLMQSLPETARQTILERVRQGAGLVVDRFDARRPDFLEGVPLQPEPAFLAGTDVQTGTLDKGRVVVGFPPLPPDPFPQGEWGKKLPTPDGAAANMFEAYYTADYYYEKLGREVLWAAGKEPKRSISLEVEPSPVSWGDVGKAKVKVRSLPGTQTTVRLRSAWTGDIALKRASGSDEYSLPPLPAGRYFVDAIARGQQGVEAWAVGELKVTADDEIADIKLDKDWYEVGETANGSVELKLSQEIGTGGARRLLRVQALDKHARELVRQDYPASGSSVSFSLPVEQFLPSLTYLRAVLVAGDREVASAISCFTVPHRRLDEWNFTMWGVIGGRHGGAAGPAANRMWLEETLARCGVTSRIATGAPWWYMTNAGMTYAAFVGGVGTPGKGQVQVEEDGTLKGFRLGSRGYEDLGVGCVNDEPAVTERLREAMRQDPEYTPVAAWRSGGTLAYMWPDESNTRGACLHPSCWKVYQQWLKEQYGSIEALNASWGYSYRSFDEIKPTVERADVLNAKEQYSNIAALNAAWGTSYKSFEEILPSIDWTAVNNEYASVPAPPSKWAGDQYSRKEDGYFGKTRISYPRYFDRLAFQYWNYANWARHWRPIAQELDPHAKVGISAPMSGLDDDMDTLVRGTDTMIVYSHLQMEVLRSMAKPGYLFGTWSGYGNNERNRDAWWQSFLRGANNTGWWWVHTFLGPHLELSSRARFIEDARPVFDGLGTLLNVRSRIQHDGIVMLDSFPSAQASKLEAGYSYGTWDPFNSMGHYDTGSLPGKGMDWGLKPGGVNNFVWHRAIRALGLQFNYVTEKMIQRGEFNPDEFKVMILSQCEAIGPKVAEAIRRFVGNGGTVVADIRPGLYDGHCKPQEKWQGVLDKLFGVRHTGNVPAVAEPGQIVIPDLAELGDIGRSGRSLTLDLGALQVNPAVEVTTGRALGTAGDTPIFIVNRVGKGRAILLNFPLCTYPNLSLPETPPQAADLLAAVFAGGGVKWPFEMVDANREPHRNIQAVRWKSGEDTEVVALFGPLNTNRSTFSRGKDGGFYRIEPWTGRHSSVPVTLKLPRARYVTVLGTPAAPHPVHDFTAQVELWRPVFLVISNRLLQAPTVEPMNAVGLAGGTMRLKIDVPGRQDKHVLKLRFTAPDGSLAPWFDRSVIVGPDGDEVVLHLAYNEHKGIWRAEATDLYNGRTAMTRFGVR